MSASLQFHQRQFILQVIPNFSSLNLSRQGRLSGVRDSVAVMLIRLISTKFIKLSFNADFFAEQMRDLVHDTMVLYFC